MASAGLVASFATSAVAEAVFTAPATQKLQPDSGLLQDNATSGSPRAPDPVSVAIGGEPDVPPRADGMDADEARGVPIGGMLASEHGVPATSGAMDIENDISAEVRLSAQLDVGADSATCLGARGMLAEPTAATGDLAAEGSSLTPEVAGAGCGNNSNSCPSDDGSAAREPVQHAGSAAEIADLSEPGSVHRQNSGAREIHGEGALSHVPEANQKAGYDAASAEGIEHSSDEDAPPSAGYGAAYSDADDGSEGSDLVEEDRVAPARGAYSNSSGARCDEPSDDSVSSAAPEPADSVRQTDSAASGHGGAEAGTDTAGSTSSAAASAVLGAAAQPRSSRPGGAMDCQSEDGAELEGSTLASAGGLAAAGDGASADVTAPGAAAVDADALHTIGGFSNTANGTGRRKHSSNGRGVRELAGLALPSRFSGEEVVNVALLEETTEKEGAGEGSCGRTRLSTGLTPAASAAGPLAKHTAHTSGSSKGASSSKHSRLSVGLQGASAASHNSDGPVRTAVATRRHEHYRGVVRAAKGKKWEAVVTTRDGSHRSFGEFVYDVDAALAYDAGVRGMRGSGGDVSSRKLNFPTDEELAMPQPKRVTGAKRSRPAGSGCDGDDVAGGSGPSGGAGWASGRAVSVAGAGGEGELEGGCDFAAAAKHAKRPRLSGTRDREPAAGPAGSSSQGPSSSHPLRAGKACSARDEEADPHAAAGAGASSSSDVSTAATAPFPFSDKALPRGCERPSLTAPRYRVRASKSNMLPLDVRLAYLGRTDDLHVAALMWDGVFAFYGVMSRDLTMKGGPLNCPSEYPRLLRLMSWARDGGLEPAPADAIAALERMPGRMLLGLDGDPPSSASMLPTAGHASSAVEGGSRGRGVGGLSSLGGSGSIGVSQSGSTNPGAVVAAKHAHSVSGMGSAGSSSSATPSSTAPTVFPYSDAALPMGCAREPFGGGQRYSVRASTVSVLPSPMRKRNLGRTSNLHVAALMWDASFAFYGVQISDLKEFRSRINCPSEYPRLLRLMKWARHGGLEPAPADAVDALTRIPERMLLGLDGDPPSAASMLPTAGHASTAVEGGSRGRGIGGLSSLGGSIGVSQFRSINPGAVLGAKHAHSVSGVGSAGSSRSAAPSSSSAAPSSTAPTVFPYSDVVLPMGCAREPFGGGQRYAVRSSKRSVLPSPMRKRSLGRTSNLHVAALLWDAAFAFYGVRAVALEQLGGLLNCPSEYPRLLRLMKWARHGGLEPAPADAVDALTRIPERMLLGLEGDPPSSVSALRTAGPASSSAAAGAPSAMASPSTAVLPSAEGSGVKKGGSAAASADTHAAAGSVISAAAAVGDSVTSAHALAVPPPPQQAKRVLPDLSSLPFPEGVQALRKAIGASKALLQLDIKVRAISGGAGAASRGDPAVATTIEDLLASLGDDMAGRADVDIDALLQCASCLMDKASEWLRG